MILYIKKNPYFLKKQISELKIRKTLLFICSAVCQPVLSFSFGNSDELSEQGPVPSKQPLREYCVRVRDPTPSRSSKDAPRLCPVHTQEPSLGSMATRPGLRLPSQREEVPRDSRGCHLFLSQLMEFFRLLQRPKKGVSFAWATRQSKSRRIGELRIRHPPKVGMHKNVHLAFRSRKAKRRSGLPCDFSWGIQA